MKKLNFLFLSELRADLITINIVYELNNSSKLKISFIKPNTFFQNFGKQSSEEERNTNKEFIQVSATLNSLEYSGRASF